MPLRPLIFLVCAPLLLPIEAQTTEAAGKLAIHPRKSARLALLTVSRHDISFSEAEPVLQDFSDELPPALQHLSRQLQDAWPDYVRHQDAQVRRRLLRGELDSMVHLLIFGTTFTSQPRLTAKFLAQEPRAQPADGAQTDPAAHVLLSRISDLLRALAAPGNNERLRQMRYLLQREGYNWQTAAEQKKLKEYLLANVLRVREEFAGYNKRLEVARTGGDLDQQMAIRSTLFQHRGLSLDTSILPDFALEEALVQLRDHGLLAKGSVRRVAIMGPGLDFVDKQEGYDFYPLQSTQPFAVMDSLVRTGCSRLEDLQVATLDISPRVNQHIALARQQAQRERGYVLQLPLDMGINWARDVRQFWRQLGSSLGTPVPPVQVPGGIGQLDIRAFRVPPPLVLRVTPLDLNVVWQRLKLPPQERFDLVIGTNIFVYYNEFEQALALDNLQSMMRENALLLTNNGLPEVRTLQIHQIGHSTSVYSDRPDDGDHIIWYQRSPR